MKGKINQHSCKKKTKGHVLLFNFGHIINALLLETNLKWEACLESQFGASLLSIWLSPPGASAAECTHFLCYGMWSVSPTSALAKLSNFFLHFLEGGAIHEAAETRRLQWAASGQTAPWFRPLIGSWEPNSDASMIQLTVQRDIQSSVCTR